MKNYNTTDIVLAATLTIIGFPVASVVVNGRRGTFVFEEISDVVVEDYHKGNITVVPVVFHRALRDLTIQVNRLIGPKI